MSKRWYQENRRDPWRREAKSKGYRARSAYKLKQIQDKFEIIRKGDYVLDIGCHPGGWTQVAVEEVGCWQNTKLSVQQSILTKESKLSLTVILLMYTNFGKQSYSS